ncbi:hypothetical protein [Stieleria varia]|uniref:hypothetical protein n=1 Tax=Stieleria varia TaxID=2528005 RepID=UPI0018D22D93|nr:hypothetical protein [Stieleria varia]
MTQLRFAFSVCSFVIVFGCLFPGCGGSTDPVAPADGEVAAFLEDNPELALPEQGEDIDPADIVD